jgi:membrane protease YdiL (CAAX protease family)
MALLLVGVYIAIAILEPLLHGGREQGLTPTGWQPDHAGAYAVNFVLIVGLTPVVEEMTFRGLGFSLLRRYGEWMAILLVGLTFGLAHGLVYGLPELALFGCALAWLRARTGSVYPGMILHGLFNAIALIAAVTVQP